MPGLGFDASGNRLGSGVGFYDRFLSNWSHLWRVGLFFEAQRLERIEPAPWDVPLDVIITEERCLILHDWPEVLRKRGESALR
ncbi:MAG: hypothetical protein KatS3mg115_2598 [Candidatus Poribacteria bacterium]|nr:MAG: hypothetical protein KatS3mg115_2598 [Candidatus Poribacteria bacterium]